MWQVTKPKERYPRFGPAAVLGLGSYKTAWAMLHKLRRAMVRSGRDRLDGVVEVDETYWGGEETGTLLDLLRAKNKVQAGWRIIKLRRGHFASHIHFLCAHSVPFS